MQLNGSQIFVEVLCEQGVDTIFGYPGGAVLNLYDELYKNSDRIHHVLTAHEQGASHAADGYARATGRTGVVLATSGPGATNLVTGIATAYMDSVPMVAFTGNVPTPGLGKDSFQEAYIEGITMPITKHNFTVRKVEELADTMRAAFRIAQSGRKGPVLVDIPKDVTAAVCEFTPKQPEQIRTVTTYDEQQVKWAADIINAAKRPLVYFGGGVRSAASCQPLRDLIHKAEIPATYTLMAAGVVPYGDPMNIGMVGMHGCYTSNRAVADCDVLIALGTRFSDRVALNPKTFARNATIIQIDIDPSELGKNVDVDLAIAGDVCYVLSGMLPLIEEKKHPDWMKMIHEWQAQDYHPVSDPTRLMPHQVIGEVCNQCGPEAVYVTDVGQHQMWAAQYIRHTKSRGFITSGGLGTMGFGYGAAIGAQMALGREQRVVMFTGDGSFHMNLNEACTAVSYELPIITVIFNNSVLGMVRQWQTTFYGRRYSQTDPHRKTDFVKLADEIGIDDGSHGLLERFNGLFRQEWRAKEKPQPEIETETPNVVDELPPMPELEQGYPMPDTGIGFLEMYQYGYTDGNAMLPLTKERAMELFMQDVPVFLLYADSTEAMALDAEDISSHTGVFGVEREEWDAVRGVVTLSEQADTEKLFLENPQDAFLIYQIRRGGELDAYRFMNYDYLQSKGVTPERGGYDAIYTGGFMDYGNARTNLDMIYQRFNVDHPADFKGHSLSVSDIVALKQNGVVSCHYVDSIGFRELPNFLKPENYLKNVEMLLEDDYGMIDGIINNGPKQPTVADLEAQVKAGFSISLTELAAASHREQKKPSVLEKLRERTPEQSKNKTAPKRSAEREL